MASKNELVPKEVHLANAGLKNLPSHWSVVEIGELLSEDRGISVGVMYPGNHDPLGVPLIKVGDLMGSVINPNPEFRVTPEKHYEYRRTELEGGELLLTLVGAVGQCAIVPPSMAGWNAARAVAVLRLKNPEDAKFVRLCLLSAPLQHLMQVWANTTVQATLNLKEIKQLPLPWPPKEERKEIAHILGTLDDKIELNQQMNQTLEAIARALFKSWFIDFDPVRAKISSLQPVGMDAETAALFPDEFEDSAIGEIPKGWKAGKLKDISNNPKRSIKPEQIPSNTPYIGLEHMPRRSIALSDWDSSDEIASNKYEFKQGEILFGKLRPYFHKVGIAVLDGVCSTDILVITPKNSDWFSLVLAYVSSSEFVEYTNMASDGTRMPRTSWQIMSQYDVILPSIEIASVFSKIATPFVQQIRSNIFQSRSLAEMRDRLLPKLLSGELSIKDAEKFVGTAT